MQGDLYQREIPTPLTGALARLRRRARRLALAKGTAGALITFIVAALAAMAIDRFIIIYDWRVRMGISAAVFLAALAVVIGRVLVPMVRLVSMSALAATFEETYPRLQERFSSTVSLLTSRDPDAIRGSDAMIRELVREAASEAARVSPGDVISFRRAGRAWVAAAVLLAACSALAITWPDQFALLARRLFVPNARRAFLTHVSVQPRDPTVPLGEPLKVRATVTQRHARNCDLILRRGDTESRFAMARSEAPGATDTETYVCAIPAAEDGMQYQVRANDAYTAWHTIRAVPRPRAERLDIACRFPAYTGRKPRTVEAATGHVQCLRNTELTFTVQPNKPCAAAVLEFSDKTTVALEPADGTSAGANRYQATVPALRNATYRVLLTDAFGFSNIEPATHEIEVIKDRPPSVRITSPARRLTLRPDEKVPVRFIASDDLAVTGAELLVATGAEPRPLATVGRQIEPGPRLEATLALDLAALELDGVREVRYRVRVTDSLPPELDNGPQRALSAVHVIRLDANAEPLALQVLKSLRDHFREALDKMDRQLAEAEKRSADLKDAAADRKPFDRSAARSAEEARSRLRESVAVAHAIARTTEDTGYRKLGAVLRDEIAERHVAPAAQYVGEGSMSPEDAAQRRHAFGAATTEIQQARKKLGALAARFDELTRYEESARRIAQAAAKQSEVAARLADTLRDKPAPATSDDALKRLSTDQQKLLDTVQKILAQDPEMARQALAQQRARQKTLTARLNDLARQEGQLRRATHREQQRGAAQSRPAGQPSAIDEAFAEAARALADATARAESPIRKLADLQRQLAEQAAGLAAAIGKPQRGPAEPQPGGPSRTAGHAASAAKQAAKGIRRMRRAPTETAAAGKQALAKQKKAAELLNRVARQLADLPIPGRSASEAATARAYRRAMQADQAGRLAAQQRLLAAELEALVRNKPHAAIAARQERVRHETAQFARDARALARQIAGTQPDLAEPTEQARQLVAQKAAQAQAQAARQAAQHQLPQAEQQMAAAQSALEGAAKQFGAIRKQLARTAGKSGKGNKTKKALGKSLNKAAGEQGESLAGMDDAQQSNDGQGQAQGSSSAAGRAQAAAAQAAASLQSAAEQFMAAANALGSEARLGKDPSSGTAGGKGRGSMGVRLPDMRSLNLEMLGITRSQWARLPGELRDEIIQAADDEAPAQYRELIQQYFRYIAQKGSNDAVPNASDWRD